jgi:hypothetical protein
MIRAVAAFVGALAGGIASHAQDSSDHLIVGVSAQRMENADGTQVDLDWTRTGAAGVLSLGVNDTAVGSSRWTLFKAGAARTLSRGIGLSGNLDHGPASIDGERTRFTRLRAMASIPVRGNWTLQIADQFVDVEPVSGHFLSGIARLARGAASFEWGLTDAISGTLDHESLSFRFDYRGAPPYVMGGLALGRSNNRLVLQGLDTDSVAVDLREAFAGVAAPIGRAEILFVMDAARAGDTRRLSLSAVLRMPIGR